MLAADLFDLHSGKSSLVLTLLRLLDTSSGTITINGIDITSIPHDILRSHIIAVAEEPFFFPGTIRDNLDPYGEFKEDMLIEALNDVNLYSVVIEKGGLDTKLEKDMFSHGQRQLFSIARAIVRRFGGKLLILDEVTSRYVSFPFLLYIDSYLIYEHQPRQGFRTRRQPRHSAAFQRPHRRLCGAQTRLCAGLRQDSCHG
jgi:hypothetical protein